VQDALRAAIAGVPDPLRQELRRVLTDMTLATARAGRAPDTARAALARLAARVDRLEFRTFADTLGQAWQTRLAGDALVPLAELLRITRDRDAEETIARLDMVLTSAPGFALFGVVTWIMGGFLLRNLTGGGGLW
jgi:hypothetical protein